MLVFVIQSKICAYRRYRETIRELMQFPNPEFEDLGSFRYEIEVFARPTVVSSTTSSSHFDG
jgi:uncharacterized protein YjiS (DUF1127 family)